MLPAPPPDLKPSDYAAIEEAVMETARGRWFLMEFARRQRAAETQRLTDLADRLEAMLAGAQFPPPAAPPPVHERRPDAEKIAERLSDIVWSMRERGFDGALCSEIDRQARLVRDLGRRIFESLGAPVQQQPMTPPPRALPAPEPAPRPFARLDALPMRERLALFA